MNKIFALVLLCTAFAHASDNKWTGTITMEEKYKGLTGWSEKYVTVNFQNAIPTLYRENVHTTDLTFTDDKGTGSVRLHAEAIIGGKKMSTTDCSGSGQSELHEVVVDETDQRYTISAIGPPCSGTTINHIDGSSEPYGPEIPDIVISTQRLTNSNQLSGTLTETGDTGVGPFTRTIKWNLIRGAQTDIELIVTPSDYDRWIPEPGKSELIKGSVMEVTFKLQSTSGGSPSKKATSFEVRLSNTSKEPGITLNIPLNPASRQLPDLRLIPHPAAESIQADQSLTVATSDGIHGKTYIASYDGGGYTTMTVEAVLQGGRRIKGHLLVPGGDTDILIPKRIPNSYIATVWQNANGNPQDTDDKEKSPGNSNDGDGFTAYEEYRGFMSEGTFKRLDPQEKELAVRVWSSELQLFSEGIQWFEAASGLTVVRFHIYEVPQSRRINGNSGTAHAYKQFAIPLVKGSLPAGSFAKAYTASGDAEIPARTTGIVVAVNNLTQIYQAIQRNPMPVPFTESELLGATIAHELGHGVAVPHHGDLPDEPSPQIATDNTYRIFNMFGTEITNRPYTIDGIIGIAGGAESGDMSCIMAYNPYYNWSFRQDANGTRIFHQVPLMVMGRSMCKSRLGTGINAPSPDPRVVNRYFGKATNGNCLSRIKLWE